MTNDGARPLRIWTFSNGLSILRLLLAAPVAYLAQNAVAYRWEILGLCVAAYLTDLGDGFIARRFRQESDFGRIIDPVADKVYVGVFAVSLLVAGTLPAWYLALVIGRDLLILAGGVYLKSRRGVLAQSNYPGKAAVVTVGLTLLISLFRAETGSLLSGALVVSSCALAYSFFEYARKFVSVMKTHSRVANQ